MADDEQQTPTGDTSEQFEEKPPEDKIEEIEKERERRLDPDNRPENAEVDNSGKTLPTVEEFKDGRGEGTRLEVEVIDPFNNHMRFMELKDA